MMRRLVLLAVAVLTTACGLRPPITHSLSITPTEDVQTATLTVRTELDPHPANRGVAARQDAVRRAILEDRDEWSLRFRAGQPETERTIFDRSQGVLQRVERTAVVRGEELQRVFADAGLTIQMTRGDGWAELAMYPGSGGRGTREQREHLQRAIRQWSEDAARYFRAIDRLYSYLRSEPNRKEPVFTILFAGDDQRSVIDEEDALIRDLTDTMSQILDHIEAAENNAVPLDEEFDLVYNPFPAEITVHTPKPIVAVEGFARRGDDLLIPRASLLDAIEALQGRWISPDPLALILRKGELATVKELAATPLKSSPVVTPQQIQDALLGAMKVAPAYRVRWESGVRRP